MIEEFERGKEVKILEKEDKELYDVLVTDGELNAKCVVSPRIKELRDLRVGSLVTVTEWWNWKNELDLNKDSTITTILELKIESYEDERMRELKWKEFEYHKKSFLLESELMPLISQRKFYMKKESDDCILLDKKKLPRVKLNQETLEENLFIAEIIENHENGIKKKNQLIGKILKRSRIYQYAKTQDKKSNYPLKFDVWLADDSSIIKIIFWGNLCKFYHSTKIDQVIVLNDYSIRESISPNYPSSLDALGINVNTKYEISLNSRKNKNVVSELALNTRISKLYPSFNFPILFQYQKIKFIKDSSVFNFLFLLTFVGRIEFEYQKYQNYKNKRVYRWVKGNYFFFFFINFFLDF